MINQKEYMKLNIRWMSSAVTLLLILIYGCHTTESQSPYPEKLITQGPANGTLLIIGGSASDQFFLKFMDLVGGKDEPIVVIPTAASSEEFSEEFLENYKGRFTRHGFTNVTVLHTRDRDEANSDEFIEPINEASGVWFSGGRQWRHADSYLNTKSHEAFNNLLERGGVIAGSSAGATIQGSYLARGDTKANTIMINFQIQSNKIQVDIIDNGIGFNPKLKSDGIGLKNMSSRVDRLNGAFKVISEPNKGTTISIKLTL